jgi:hypothetical protein
LSGTDTAGLGFVYPRQITLILRVDPHPFVDFLINTVVSWFIAPGDDSWVGFLTRLTFFCLQKVMGFCEWQLFAWLNFNLVFAVN